MLLVEESSAKLTLSGLDFDFRIRNSVKNYKIFWCVVQQQGQRVLIMYPRKHYWLIVLLGALYYLVNSIRYEFDVQNCVLFMPSHCVQM